MLTSAAQIAAVGREREKRRKMNNFWKNAGDCVEPGINNMYHLL
jgi:hypothetical protein